MPYTIKEPTYSARETELYCGCCKMVNNIVCRKELFNHFTMTDYSNVFGLFIYLIAGWGKSGDVDLAVQVIDRYGKDLEEKYGNKYAVKELKVLNRSYLAIRKATDSFQKTSIDVNRIMDCQAEQMLKICGIVPTAAMRKFIFDNILYFINYYMDKTTFELNLPVYGDRKTITSDRIPEWIIDESNADNGRVIKNFYDAVNKYPAGWLKFHFDVRIPVGIVLSVLYTLPFVFQGDLFEVIVRVAILSLDLLFLYLMMRRTPSSKVWLYIEFTYVFLVSLLSLDVINITVVGIWTLFNYVYFGKNIVFFDKTVWGRTCTIETCENIKSISTTEKIGIVNQNTENDIQTSFCNKCGAPLILGASFCNKCGNSIIKIPMKVNEGNNTLNGIEKKTTEAKVQYIKTEQVTDSELTTKAFEEKEASTSQNIQLDDDKMDQLRKWKTLLDEGIIAAEEFEQKKKEILNL